MMLRSEPVSFSPVVSREKPKKIQSIQVLRGLAVILVLCRHLLVMEGKYGRNEMLLGDFFKIGDAGVDLFFVISGFVMVTVTANLFQQAGAVTDFLWKRAIRIYPIYWIYSLMILPVYLTFPNMVNSSQPGHMNLFSSFTLWPQSRMPLLGQGWTLTYELYFYFVFSLTLFAPARFLPYLLGLWAAIVATGWNFHQAKIGLLQNAVAVYVFNPLTLEFILGCAVAILIRHRERGHAFKCLSAGVLLIVAGTWIGDPLKIPGMRLFAFGLPATMIVYGAVALELTSGFQYPRFLEKVGDASYSIYLSHILVISAVGRVWQVLGVPGLWDNALAICVMIVAALLVGFASYRYLEHPMVRFFHTRQFKGFQSKPANAPAPS